MLVMWPFAGHASLCWSCDPLLVMRVYVGHVTICMSHEYVTISEQMLLSIKEIVSSTESLSRRLDRVTGTKLREEVKRCLDRAKSNLSGRERDALRSLQRDDSIVVLPADKGNATVVMDRTSYNSKMMELLSDGSYKVLNRNPTTGIEKRVEDNLKKVFRNGHLEEALYKRLVPKSTPKVHKPLVPLRPIVCMIGSATYNLARELTRMFNPLTGRTSSFVKNSAHFVEMVRCIGLEDKDRLVSFDVKSLFTRVPVDEALEVILTELNKDEDRKILTLTEVVRLVEICLQSTSFQYNNIYYEQIEGTVMGSPLSPVIANLYMEFFKLPFLDVQLVRNGSSLETSVYRKKTHTDRYLHYNSHHHPRVKVGTCIVKTLKDRASRICQSSKLRGEISRLQEVFEDNGYSTAVVKKVLQRRKLARPTDTEDKQEMKTLCLPYAQGLSERIERTCKKLDVRAVFKSSKTLRGHLWGSKVSNH